jgi:hypothetical protein
MHISFTLHVYFSYVAAAGPIHNKQNMYDSCKPPNKPEAYAACACMSHAFGVISMHNMPGR